MNRQIEDLCMAEAANQIKARYRAEIRKRIKAHKIPYASFSKSIQRAEKYILAELLADVWRLFPKKKLQDKLRKELKKRIEKL